MNEDFGTPEAVAVLFDLAAEVNRTQSTELSGLLKALGGVLGLLQTDPLVFLQTGNNLDAADETAQINELIAARAAAKQAKDFAKADQIRQQLLDMGVVLKDSAQGTLWERA
jgi:cysteinyl-tRNA synthetase